MDFFQLLYFYHWVNTRVYPLFYACLILKFLSVSFGEGRPMKKGKYAKSKNGGKKEGILSYQFFCTRLIHITLMFAEGLENCKRKQSVGC